MKSHITAKRVRELLDYNPDTGVITNRVFRGPRAAVGAIAGTLNVTGYWQVKIDGLLVKAHRLAWLHFYGSWPLQSIDHIDGNRANNRIANLRDVSHAVNLQNQTKASSHNKAGILGVTWSKEKRKWKAQITANGRGRHIGYFTTPEEAHAAYLAAKLIYHPEASISMEFQA